MEKLNKKESVFIGRHSVLKQKVVIHDLDGESYVMYDLSEARCKFDADLYTLCLEREEVVVMGKTVAEPCWKFGN